MLTILQKISLFSEEKTYIHAMLKGVFILLICLFVPALGFAQQEIARSEEELKSLQRKIALVKRNIATQQKNESTLLLELKKIEQQIVTLEKDKLIKQQELVRSREEMADIQQQIAALQKDAANMQNNLSDIVRTRYLLQDQNIIKLILNQEDPEAVSRSLIYYQNVAQAGDRFLTRVKKQEQELQTLNSQLDTKQRQITQTLAQLKQQQQAIEAKNDQRKQRLAQIRQDLKKENKQVTLYQSRHSELQLLLKQLYRDQKQKEQAKKAARKAAQEAAKRAEQVAKEAGQPAAKPPSADAIRRLPGKFANAKGQMYLPVSGKVIHRFGDKDAESGITYSGVMISATEGQPVRAIHGGQIVYADWFRGYGQLLVIDHGDGYMSLYGHNQVLLTRLGDVVQAGQQIALAGQTGGLTSTGLYFEIRVQGEPEDPLRWCRA